ncbi:MAG: poly[(R)-3-hydroxyalkanoate] polymerase subunit PhaC [Sphingomonadales bacterium]|jgi:polyhydroxyalkanoate synthase|nr:poly[(R)-3-hydroxyalkanoate] polymerase subunit PhaC [Sphingomonadales bacterium]
MLRRETEGSPERLARALAGLRRYQEAERAAAAAPPAAVAELLGAKVRDYGGGGPPVLFVPSLINPPSILDLPGRSLLRWLAAEGGVRPLLLDWGWDVEARSALSVAGHVEQVLLPLIERLGERPALVGYCLGGTMALAAAGPSGAPAVAAIAAPWRFGGFPDESRAMIARLWEGAAAASRTLGCLPMEVLQSAFWSLDPARTVAKFEAFAGMEEGGAEARAFVTLEDWANDGPPLPHSAALELFEDFFGADVTGRGLWRLADPAALPCPFLDIVSTSDRIVPAASATGSGERLELAQGHVGMVVGGRSRSALWEPLAAWLSRNAAQC